jgi:penicillin-binding protein 1A
MRWGLEQSRNLMTVRIANDTGMQRVVTFRNVGIGDYKPYLSFALGAGETTVRAWSTPIRPSPTTACSIPPR